MSTKNSFAPVLGVLVVLALAAGGLFLAGVFDGGEEPKPHGVVPETPAPSVAQAPETPSRPLVPPPSAPIAAQEFDRGRHDRGTVAFADGELGVRGIVEDSEGRGLAGADVLLIRDLGVIRSQPRDGEVLARARTGAGGAFSIPGLVLGEVYILQAAHAGHATERRHPIDPADARTLDQTIRLGPGVQVSGRVVDEHGAPIEGAEILAYEMTLQGEDLPAAERTVKSGGDGTYALAHLKGGLKRLLARKAGFATDGRNNIDLKGGDPVAGMDFTLLQGLTIRGVVRDRTSELPVKGVIVKGTPVSPLIPDTGAPPGYDGEDGAGQEAEAAEKGDDTGRAQRARKAVADPRVQMVMQKLFVSETAVTDDQGVFVLSGLLPARYTLAFKARGYLPLPSVPADAGADNLAIPMARSARIAGTVVDHETGMPLTGPFSVALVPNPDPTQIPPSFRQRFQDEQGRFEYLDARPGTQHLLAEAAGYAGGRTDPLQIAVEQQVIGITIRLLKGAEVKGSVRDTKGQPVAGVRISLGADRGSGPVNPFEKVLLMQGTSPRTKVAVTDAEGKWTIANVMPGSYKAKAEHPDHCDEETAAFAAPERGEHRAPDLVLLTGATIAGVIRTKTGEPDAKATFSVTSADPAHVFSRTVNTDAAGGFEVKGLRPGSYRAVVTTREGQVDLMQLIKSQQDPSNLVSLRDGEVRKMEL